MKYFKSAKYGFILLGILLFSSCTNKEPLIEIPKGSRIGLIGNNLGSRMMNFGHFETELHLRYPSHQLYIRNFCDGGNTAGFTPHSGREEPWAFPGADNYQTELAQNSNSRGHFETQEEWLDRHDIDLLIGFFGYNESFEGSKGLANFKAELEAFISHSTQQTYGGSTPQLVLVSPIAHQKLDTSLDLPDPGPINANLSMYSDGMREVANKMEIPFVDSYTESLKWYETGEQLTIDGSQLNDNGYKLFSEFLASKLGKNSSTTIDDNELREAILDKNWYWHNDFKIPNGVHVFGRRYDPFGPDNYPYELEKIRQLTAIRDTAIWSLLAGQDYDIEQADSNTIELPEVETNYSTDGKTGNLEYLYGDEAISTFTMAPGFEIELFASEEEFPDLANPVQLSFDNQGRLWVAVMPSYPHYKPGDSKPDDKLIILEDSDGDGKADKQTVFKDGLHLPIGFEFAPEGVYVSQGTNLKLYTDTNDDDVADTEEIIYSGFDDHDTHHAISAFCSDPSGAIYMAEGVFLHTNVETPYGPVRATNGGFYRFQPQNRKLERVAQLSIPNPWGIAFDEWGQNFFAETSGTKVHWMMPGSIKSRYGIASPKGRDLIVEEKVRPTSGLEFISSRHFPDELQGDLLINNNIGFLGTKQHQVLEDGTGYTTKFRQDLLSSSDNNFRPVDMEFAPDGSLYVVDWHNILIGHMQHNARDPFRDHAHGRIYRATYPDRPLVEPAEISGAPIPTLLENLKLPEYRTRYRTRRELRGRDEEQVKLRLEEWVANMSENDPNTEKYLLEALWVSWGFNNVDQNLLERLLAANNYKIRTAAVRVVRYANIDDNQKATYLKIAASDENGRVRLEASVAASWLSSELGLEVLAISGAMPVDDWMLDTYRSAEAHLNGRFVERKPEHEFTTELTGNDRQQYFLGQEIYFRDSHCGTCHQADGQGLKAAGFPPLAETDWVNGDPERLIKITLNGMMGPITVLDHDYPGQVPMTPFKDLLDDNEIAAVLTFVRNSFGNSSSPVSAEEVQEIRASSVDKKGFYSPEELQSTGIDQ